MTDQIIDTTPPEGAPHGSEVGRFVMGTFYTFSSFVLVKFIMAVNSIVVARLLEPGDLGILTILDQTYRVVLIVAYFGIPLALVKYISELAVTSKDKIKTYLSTAISIVMVSATVFCLAYILLRDKIAAFYQTPILGELILYYAVTTFAYAFYETGSAILKGHQRVKAFSTLNVIRWLIIVPVNIVLILWFGLRGAVLAIMVCSCINLLLMLGVLNRGITRLKMLIPSFFFKPGVTRKLLHFGVPAMLSDVLLIFPMWIALSYLSKQTDFVNVGYYRVAYSLTLIVMFIPMAIAVPIIPLFSELEKRNVQRMEGFFRQSIRLTALVMIPVTTGMALFSKVLVPMLYGAEYFPAWHILFFFSAGVYYYAITSIIGYLIAGTGKMWQGSLLNLIWTLFFVGFSILFIREYGLVGLGIAYLLSYIVHTITSFAYLRMHFRIHFLKIKNFLLFGFVVYCVTYLLLRTTILNEQSTFIISLILWFSVLFLCYKLLSKDDRRSLSRILRTVPFLREHISDKN